MTRLTGILACTAIAAIGHAAWGQTTAPATPTGLPVPNTLPAKSVDVPVTRVVLFSSGVGYFEHNGTVIGNATSALQFETAQINDVLKSLVVFDRSGGSVGAITYPANDPVSRTLRSFDVNLSGDPPLADILKQIRGAKVQVAMGDEVITGTILGVEAREKPVAAPAGTEKTLKTWVVNLVTDGVIRSVSLDEIRKLEILDDKIEKEMNQALAALAQARDQSKKTVTVHFDSKGVTGSRTVGMGYLVETPIWKPTYRLLLADGDAKKAQLQGWAIVENQTDNDWNDVALSLVGGRPISYIELLYQPMYISRPVVSPSVMGSIVPQTYDNGITPGMASAATPRMAPSLSLGSSNNGNGGGGLGNTGGQGQGGGIFGNQSVPTGGVVGGEAPNPMEEFNQGVSAVAEASKIGEMFHFSVDKVSLPRQQSSMIPIIADSVSVDRISIYSPAISTKYSMRGVRMHNDTGKFLLAGPVTVMDVLKDAHNYAGDAKILDIPAGQSRLLGYAIDQDLVIQPTPPLGDETLLSGTLVRGVLHLKYRSQLTTDYALQNKGDTEKTIILEHPLAEGYELKEPAQYDEKTDKVYRFEIKLAGKASKNFRVMVEWARPQEVTFIGDRPDFDDTLSLYLKQSAISPKVKEALQTIAAKRGAIADLDRKIKDRTADRAQIAADQTNIRENIRVLPASSKSQEDAIRQLTTSTDELTALDKELKDLHGSLDAARSDLATFIESTSIE